MLIVEDASVKCVQLVEAMCFKERRHASSKSTDFVIPTVCQILVNKVRVVAIGKMSDFVLPSALVLARIV